MGRRKVHLQNICFESYTWELSSGPVFFSGNVKWGATRKMNATSWFLLNSLLGHKRVSVLLVGFVSISFLGFALYSRFCFLCLLNFGHEAFFGFQLKTILLFSWNIENLSAICCIKCFRCFSVSAQQSRKNLSGKVPASKISTSSLM